MSIDNDFESKTLIVYIKDSHYKYYDLFISHLYEVKENHVIVYSRDPETGEERVKARFAIWDYFIIE